MAARIWERFLTERDKALMARTGYGASAGFGLRPALLVVDVNYQFCGDRRESILQAVGRWRNACGEEAWQAVDVIGRLAPAFRARGLPVIYTTGGGRPDGWDRGGWQWKNTRHGEQPPALPRGLHPNSIVIDIAPQPQDILIVKQKPSAFFGTNLPSYLQWLGADSLIIAGGVTSGCVRASALDAFNLNFKVSVVEDACFDRSEASHAINLYDLHLKYADVVDAQAVHAYIDTLPADLFAGRLPRSADPV